MIDRESVIRELTQHIARADYIETDWMDCVSVPMLRGALELLKEQGPRVLTQEEVKRLQSLKDGAVWIETFGGAVFPALPEISASHISYFVAIPFNNYRSWVENEYYGKTWRCWSARQTDEQKEATPWME